MQNSNDLDEEIRDSLRKFLSTTAGEAQMREHINLPGGYDEDLWKRMATELGVQGLGIKEEHGGAGLGFKQLQLVQEEFGRALYTGPFFATVVLAARLLELATAGPAAPSASKWLEAIAAGELTATLAYREGTQEFDAANLTTKATQTGQNWLLNGVKQFVINGATADIVLVVAETQNGVGVFATTSGAVEATSLSALDHTRALAKIELNDAPAQLLLEGTDALDEVLEGAMVLLAAEQIAGASKLLEMTVKYTSERFQFGRAVGSFQAVKHHAANMLLELEKARATVDRAVEQIVTSNREIPALSEAAAVTATEAYVFVAETATQLHGGMGVTWEYPAHFYLKRAKANQVLMRSPRQLRQDIASAFNL